MSWRVWTADEDAQLRAWSRDGVTVPAMAERLGRTFRATAQRIERLGIRSPRQQAWSSLELARARMLYDTGISPTEIGRRLRRSPASVRRALARHGGLDLARKGNGNRRTDTRVYDLRRRGLTYREILLVLGREDTPPAARTLSSWFRRWCQRTGLAEPYVFARRKVDHARVEAERARLGAYGLRDTG